MRAQVAAGLDVAPHLALFGRDFASRFLSTLAALRHLHNCCHTATLRAGDFFVARKNQFPPFIQA
jgi:hypothetical protein